MSRFKRRISLGKVMLLGLFVLVFGQMPANAQKINVIATTSIIGDIVKNVAGDSVNLITLVGPNGDAHEYEPIPADAVNIAHADIIFENGLHLEHWLDKLYEASGSKAKRVIVSEGVVPRVFEDNPQEVDPHAWQDVANVILYTEHVRDALMGLDPAHKAYYASNAADYIARLQKLDAWVKQEVAAILVDKRRLVTNHDALGYFARAYGFKIIGAVIPSATTEASDPSARQTVELLKIIKANGVHAIFSENMANPKLAQTLSQEAGIKVGPQLYTDALGSLGSEGESYIKMITYNVVVFKKCLK